MQANWEAVSPFCTTCLMHYATFGDCHLKFDGIEWATDVVLRHAVWQQLGHWYQLCSSEAKIFSAYSETRLRFSAPVPTVRLRSSAPTVRLRSSAPVPTVRLRSSAPTVRLRSSAPTVRLKSSAPTVRLRSSALTVRLLILGAIQIFFTYVCNDSHAVTVCHQSVDHQLISQWSVTK